MRFGHEGVFFAIEGLPDLVASRIADFIAIERPGPLVIAYSGTLRAYFLARTFHFLSNHEYLEWRQPGHLGRANAGRPA